MLEVGSFGDTHNPSAPNLMQTNNIYRQYSNQDVHNPVWPEVLPIETEAEKQNAVVHWTSEGPKLATTTAPSPPISGEEEEYRPFTPPLPRERLSYTRYQLDLLNGIYNEVRYPNSTQKHLIAKRVGITRDQVKIWFQNRRRKDVVGTSKSKPKEAKDDRERTEADSTTSDPKDKSPSSPSTVPPMVMSSVIGELVKYKNEPAAKNSKVVKKSKAKKKIKIPETLKTSNNPTQDALDMIAPPNEVTPNAFIAGASNGIGFRHSIGASAFDTPKDYNRVPPVFTPVPESFGHRGFGPSFNQSSDYFTANTRMNYASTFPGASGSATIEHRPPTYPGSNNHLSQQNFMYSRGNSNDSHPSQCHVSPVSESLSAIPRVHPVPFTAEPPVRLSTIKHRAYNFPYNNFPANGAREEVAQELRIASVNNNYYMSHLQMAQADHSAHSTYTHLIILDPKPRHRSSEVFCLETIGKWTNTLKLRHEFGIVGRRASVEVLKDVTHSKIDIPGLDELRDVLVKTAFLVETDTTGWPPKPMMPITALQRIKKSTTNRMDVDKVLLLERESKKLNRLVNTHKRVILLLRKMKMEKWDTYNIQKEKELRAKISESSVELVGNITALLEERVNVILADLKKMVRDFSSSRSKMLSKLLEETDIKILARQVLLPTQCEYVFPQLEKFTDKTGDCLPAPMFLKPLKLGKRYDDGDHERTPLLVDEFDENTAEHDQTSSYFKVLRNSSNSSQAFLKLRIGQTIKQKLCDTEGKVAFGWKRIFKFGPKTFGFFHTAMVTLDANN
ncbi:hypothetical protein ScPMuIL_014729 [Solemya velum]